jgi:chromosome segregation protein
MRLKRVEMIGFKSFMDRTVLDFRDGITTVLGPNGCGKSNVVDAVRWVLGEQSAKQLRGEKMEDVIFKGTRKRKPLSMAEVSLVFDNSAQRLNVPYDEVAITRRVSRSGNSDYFLNKTPCRLKDIRDLFYDTGVGNNAYSVIEQEVVGQVLDPNENKVRTILEEGSGIVRYKVKRKEALRKLDLTERDLLRVEDIIEEIGKQVRSLARQVGKARRHQRLFGEVRALELIRAHHRLRDLAREIDELTEREQALTAEGAGDDAEAARLSASLETMRPELDALEQTRRDRAHAVSELEAGINAIEGELMVLREKIDTATRRRSEISEDVERSGTRLQEIDDEHEAARRERADTSATIEERERVVRELDERARAVLEQYEDARNQLAAAQQLSLGFLKEEADHKRDIATAETRLEGLREEAERLDHAVQEAETSKRDLREELADLETRVVAATREQSDVERAVKAAQEDVGAAEDGLQHAREQREAAADELARLESRHEIATRIADELEGYRAGAAALLRDPDHRERTRGAMAERLKVEPGYEAAFELVFGEDADALLVGDVRDARELADHLASEGLGMASFLADTGAARHGHGHDPSLPGRPALELARLEEEASPLLRRWLDRVRVVETNDEAVEASIRHAGDGYSFLSREGLFLRQDGLVRGGAGARRQLALFGRQEQVEELATEVERQRETVASRHRTQQEAATQLEAARQRVEQCRRNLVHVQQSVGDLSRELATRRSVLEREEKQLERAIEGRTRVHGEIDELMQRVDGMRRELGRHGADQEASEQRVAALTEQVQDLEQQRDAAGQALSEARLQLTHDRGTDRELASRLERLANMSEDLRGRIERLRSEDASLEQDLATWRATVDENAERVTTMHREREERRESLREAQEAIETRRAEVEKVQDELRAVEKRRRERSDALHEVQTRRTEMEYQTRNVTDRITEKFQTTVDEGFASLDLEAVPKELVRETDDGEKELGTVQMEQVEEMLAERQRKLDQIGPVNFVALEEYDEKKERLEFLEKQRDDLLQSKEDLLQAIDRINRTARNLFRETYEQVRANFKEIFSTLFQGGESDLVLHRADDPLEGEIEVVARPTGKRIDSVSLLSGGERALTAIALLFAVYLIKPSPFCLLDEVDAPLDDMNVGRFVRLLERFSERTQFIVITHNKLTMESADHLYGVTMEEHGVSRLVSVSFDQLDKADPIAALEDIARDREAQRNDPVSRLQAANGEG